MRTSLLTLTAILAVAAGTARAQDATFDFNALGRFDGSRAISDYMTTEYGSPISVSGARATTDVNDSTNRFIATSIQLFNRGDFEILFQDTPISGLQFQGYVLDATPGEDFSMTLYNDNVQLLVVTNVTRDNGQEMFQSDWIDLPLPANRIVVSDSGRKDVGIDNLVVRPVPEPATGALLLVGAVALIRRRRSSPH